ncbi:MAG: phospho-N-acetylmuramoyl-pentapeptide-transferase [Lentisphaeria bacterium]|nr:phospho-N-acetylmuramoyl-pentapeptide-transferase [Lentisphaeria bacterium]
MLYYLIVNCVQNFKSTPLRLIDYVTFRAGAAALTALVLVLVLGPLTVRLLKDFVSPNRYKEYVENVAAIKDKTPTMGGLLIMGAIFVSMLLWGNLSNTLVLVFLGAMLAFMLLGFVDDYRKVKLKSKDGISIRTKFTAQTVITLLALLVFYFIPEVREHLQELCVPLMKKPVWIMPLAVAVIFETLVVVGASNAVNLTDGKDGLAVGCTIFCTLTYAAFAYMSGHKVFADYLSINYIEGAGEVGVLAACIAGACIGFLWYNCNPASMFMGDTGSLALGGCIGLIAVLVKQELLLILVGWVFVMEAGSVLLQILSLKFFGRRIFLCSPIHHHFEKKGWPEMQIVVRFWIIAGICALVGLATLKLR